MENIYFTIVPEGEEFIYMVVLKRDNFVFRLLKEMVFRVVSY
jgi:hypothetical protein